jgi:hypothetical protein
MDLPDTYQREINALCKEMGVTAGPPAVTFESVLRKMDTKKLEEYAGLEMPKVFAYARSRGYYFDRLRLRRQQVEFVKTAYSPEFFINMLEQQKVYLKEFDDATNRDVLRTIDVALRKLRNATLGKNYEEGIKNALKAASITGAALYLGGLPTVEKVAQAGAAAFNLSSRAAVAGMQGGADVITRAANSVLPGLPEGIKIVVP